MDASNEPGDPGDRGGQGGRGARGGREAPPRPPQAHADQGDGAAPTVSKSTQPHMSHTALALLRAAACGDWALNPDTTVAQVKAAIHAEYAHRTSRS